MTTIIMLMEMDVPVLVKKNLDGLVLGLVQELVFKIKVHYAVIVCEKDQNFVTMEI